MKIETSFAVPVPPAEAWPLLLDVPRIAPCLPGASLTEDLGEGRYKGQATVKVGPVQLTFAGEARITDVNDEARTARVIAKGADAKGRGSASATASFALMPEGEGTRVDVVTDLQLVGAVAQYGRGAGLLKEIANELVKQFSENLRREIERSAPNTAGAESETAAGKSPFPPPAPTAQPAKELSAFALLWAALKAMVGRWLGRSPER
jgi:uncharacterized protein